MTAAARKQPRYTAHFSPTTRSWSPWPNNDKGYNWEVTDERTGLVVRHGWCRGPKRDAQAEARLAIAELKGDL